MVDRARRGDREALEFLLTSHYDRVHALCRRMLGSDADALDAAQDALLAAVRAIARFDGRSSFGTWLYRIATNACLDELRRRRRRPVVGLSFDSIEATGDPFAETRGRSGAPRSKSRLWVEDDAPAGVSDSAVWASGSTSAGGGGVFGATMSGRVADPAETATARVDVDTALGRLTLDGRSAIVLRDFCDFSYEEIAEIVGVPIGTVRSRIARARATLADLLGDSPLDVSPSEGHRESYGNPGTASDVKPCEDEARRPTPRATKP